MTLAAGRRAQAKIEPGRAAGDTCRVSQSIGLNIGDDVVLRVEDGEIKNRTMCRRKEAHQLPDALRASEHPARAVKPG